MAGAIHDALILDLVSRFGAQSQGWNSSKIAALVDPGDTGVDVFPLRPDAFRIDEAEQQIVCWEVEIEHPLSEFQIRRYVALWFDMDCVDWQLVLMVVDRHGHIEQVSIMDWYYRFLMLDVKRPVEA